MHKILETTRLILRELTLEDAYYLCQLDNNPKVMKYIGSNNGKQLSLNQSKQIIGRQVKYYRKHPGLGIWATIVKETNDFIGWTALKYLDSTEYVELGYRYLPEYWKKGYATEVSTALLDYGFNEIGLEKIVAIAQPENRASIRVLEKIGMEFVREDVYYNSAVVFYQVERLI